MPTGAAPGRSGRFAPHCSSPGRCARRVPSSLLTTQTASGADSDCARTLPTGTLTTARLAGRCARPFARGVRHPDRSSPAAIPVGRLPTLGLSIGSWNAVGVVAPHLRLARVGDPDGPAADDDAGRQGARACLFRTCPVSGSIRARVESPKTAQTEPSPVATAPLESPEGRRLRPGWASETSLNCGSIRETCPRRPCATHTAPNPNARPVGVRSSSVILRRTVLSSARRSWSPLGRPGSPPRPIRRRR